MANMMPKKKRRSRRRLPWPRLGDPIERRSSYEWSETEARDEQYRLLLKLKDHYGIEGENGWRPWYELAIAVVSEFDEGLQIVDYKAPTGKTAPRWRGAEGLSLINEVKSLREGRPNRTERWCLHFIKKRTARYNGIPFDQLVVRFAEAKKHHATKR